ncbi:hypothetical protein BC962_2406 [Gillisia mitskevichiae]|uniref:Uncharacterized protein n=1 Tax=Gillisia mitskevichiae TaxID=270921 RepID=A0A495PIS1_9FLAO|nr:hypothetical protein [Gillisia mitskevichiae]RKS50634.1 hypothetical protein BC962_2406 [Gillisia mitskevichiae]
MKNARISVMIIAVLAMCFTSCSKEDNASQDPEGPQAVEKVTLSFDMALKKFDQSRMQTMKTPVNEDSDVPMCPNAETTPAFILAMIEKPGGGYVSDGVGEANDVLIRVIDNTSDSNADGLDNYLTYEETFLELDPGDYTLRYFAVLDAGMNIMWIAPNSDDTYGPANFANFVNNPLPHVIELEEGTKHYDEVEVLCYDQAFAREYGYLFFDFQMVPLTYVCFFGNECDINGRHTPSNFKIIVWEHDTEAQSPDAFFDIVLDRSKALVEETNNAVYENGIVKSADPLCIPLPDRTGTDSYYAEIWTVDENGNEEDLIRRGNFTDTMIKNGAFDDPDSDLKKYWHFREGPYCEEDSTPCLLSPLAWYENNFNDSAFLTGSGITTGTQYSYVAPNTSNALVPEGTYTFINNPSNVHPDFANFDNGDNMMVINGSVENDKTVYYSFTCQDICPNSDYYVTFETRSVVTRSPAELRVSVDSNLLADVITTTDNFQKVGLWIRSDASGQLKLQILNDNTAPSGNDFALDDVKISNNPSIMTGLDVLVVQP